MFLAGQISPGRRRYPFDHPARVAGFFCISTGSAPPIAWILRKWLAEKSESR